MADDEISFEAAMQRLEKIVDDMENREIPLEESLKLYKEGSECARLCRKKLENARHDLEAWQAGHAVSIDEADLEDGRS